jgi:AcrR family transcriptional regulator
MSSKRRSGRRPGDPELTRRSILDAARRLFAANGYDRATIRAIAAEADVDPALVNHHFGNKRGLFIAAHELPADPLELFALLATLPVAERGAALARVHLQLFMTPDTAPFSLLRAAASDPEAAAMLREFIEGSVVPAAVSIVEQPEVDGELRVVLIASQLFGVAMARQLIGLGPLVDRELDDIVATVAPAIQRYIDAPP